MRATTWLGALGLSSMLAVLGGSAASCSSPRPPTEMVIEVDADDGVRARATSVHIEVFGRAATGAFSPTAMHDLPYEVPLPTGRWGPVVVLFPEDRDATRFYRVRAIALDDAGAEITRVQLISSYVEGVSLRFRLFLQSSCEGVACDAENETCRDGGCVPAYIDPEDLLDGGIGMDAGPGLDAPGLDAPGLDAPGLDAPGLDAPADGGPVCGDCDDGRDCTLDRCIDGICTHDVGCDDFVACTLDACAGDGSCVNTPMNSLCTGGGECAPGTCDAVTGCSFVPDASLCDDSNPCTADSCVLITGCLHTSDNGVACDDGTFCNGPDTCIGGTCSGHPGSPCGTSTCDEGTDRCTGCPAMPCPGPTTGPWSGCTSTSACTGERTRLQTTYACGAGGVCVPSTTTEIDTSSFCNDLLDGAVCNSRSCTPTDTCGGFSDACDESGTIPRSCTRYACAAGSCAGVPDGTDSMPCSRGTDGVLCDSSCTAYTCSYADATCSTSGLSRRTCSPSYCSAEACMAGTAYSEPNPAGNSSCNRSTNGVSCGPCLACSAGSCSLDVCVGDAGPLDAGFDGGFDAGFDAGRGDAGRSEAGPGSDSGLMVPDSGSCGAAPCCTNPTLCFAPTPFCCPGGGSTPDGCSFNPCVG